MVDDGPAGLEGHPKWLLTLRQLAEEMAIRSPDR